MIEKEMEDLIWMYPERFLAGEELTKQGRQVPVETGIADLVFRHALGYLLIVEIKRGALPREAMPHWRSSAVSSN